MERIADNLAEVAATPSAALWPALHLFAAIILTTVIVLTLLRRRRRRREAAQADVPNIFAHPVATAPSRGHWGNMIQRREAEPATAEAPAAVVGGSRDPGWRIQAVAAHGYRTRPILSRSQARLMPLVERIVYTRGHGPRLLTPTALGQLLEPVPTPSVTPDRLSRAARALEGVTIAMPLVDSEGHLVAAIDVRGPRSLMPGGDEADQIKRTVLRRAAVPLIEVGPNDEETDLRAVIEPLLTTAPPAVAG